MSSQSAPAPPDYTPIAQASEASAKIAAATAADQLNWAKQTYADNKGVTDTVVNKFLQMQDTNNETAAKDRSRYEGTYQPLEDSLAKEAQDYSSDGRKDLEIGRAQSTVGQNFQAARTNAQRDLEAYGVNPNSTRFAALDIGARTQEAAAKAGAGNQASQMVDATGRALRSEAINVGRGYPGQIAGQYNTSLQSGTGAVNTGLATTASGASTMGTGVQWNGQANNALSQWGNTLNQSYGNQMQQFNANQKSSSGIGSALGLIGGLATTAIPGSSLIGKMFADGGEVPDEASPSGGAQTDDVSASGTGGALRVNAGEFIVPKETVAFKGTEFFHKLITKSRENEQQAKQESGAIPQLRTQSHATQRPRSAIPMMKRAA
jgi:hypothetical protein